MDKINFAGKGLKLLEGPSCSAGTVCSADNDSSFFYFLPAEALQRLKECRTFCDRVSQTASMHSPPVTPTESNMHRLLMSALTEIGRQLEGLELDVTNCPSSDQNGEVSFGEQQGYLEHKA